MTELTYCNGAIRSGQELSISVLDAGFVQGVTVSEQLRTFGGKLFALDEHFARLRRSLEVVGLQDIDLDNLRAEAGVIASHNHSLQQPGDDIGLTIFVTPGSPPVLKRSVEAERSVGMSTTPLPFHRWADNYANGVSLVVTSVRQVPANCWPPELKCRSRMHYFLADREAQNAPRCPSPLAGSGRFHRGSVNGQCAGVSRGGGICGSAAGEGAAEYQCWHASQAGRNT